VALLLSGGVDSALALNCAVAAGHAVSAFYLQIWFEEDFRNSWDACPWEEDLAYARATCAQAGVPLQARAASRRLAPGRAPHSPIGHTGGASHAPVLGARGSLLRVGHCGWPHAQPGRAVQLASQVWRLPRLAGGGEARRL
jgi:hypothetical protein